MMMIINDDDDDHDDRMLSVNGSNNVRMSSYFVIGRGLGLTFLHGLLLKFLKWFPLHDD